MAAAAMPKGKNGDLGSYEQKVQFCSLNKDIHFFVPSRL